MKIRNETLRLPNYTPSSPGLWLGNLSINTTKRIRDKRHPSWRPPHTGNKVDFVAKCGHGSFGDCGSVGRVVALQSEGCGFDSSFLLPYVNVPLGKALNLKLPADLRIGV
ncbi:hypothetical protein GOODEAATRI_005542 [Goodea atripinnis]|uniref:Uncharacterized protein n=1 Tax=Goodea atripinnis TaxID=208336 RepID=A0ABV0PLD0_9TELE